MQILLIFKKLQKLKSYSTIISVLLLILATFKDHDTPVCHDLMLYTAVLENPIVHQAS